MDELLEAVDSHDKKVTERVWIVHEDDDVIEIIHKSCRMTDNTWDEITLNINLGAKGFFKYHFDGVTAGCLHETLGLILADVVGWPISDD